MAFTAAAIWIIAFRRIWDKFYHGLAFAGLRYPGDILVVASAAGAAALFFRGRIFRYIVVTFVLKKICGPLSGAVIWASVVATGVHGGSVSYGFGEAREPVGAGCA